MSAKIVKCTTVDGRPIEFVDEVIGSGAMKDVYFSPDRSYVVCFFSKEKNKFYQSKEAFEQQKDRLKEIVGNKWQGIFNGVGGDYWKNIFCWPDGLVEYNDLLGITAPTYKKQFFFDYGSKNNDFLNIKGKEKEGKWFASANNQNRFLDDREKGTWLNYLKISILISRAVRRMHAAGLAHSDLSYKNVLIDPVTGSACVIDVDGLVVPGKYPPDVVGTPDFIAPEVVMTSHLNKDDPKRILPSITTDRHALAVLIYMYLLYRHPLRGGKIHDMDDPQKDENLAMGERALFVEHPDDQSNRVKANQLKPSQLPWADPAQIPYTVTGPYLTELFNKSFIEGLHEPSKRPSANDWEIALVKTVDLVQPCLNPACSHKWYVFDNTTQPSCPFCKTTFKGKLPILNLYSARQGSSYRPDNHRLMVWTGQSLFAWHANSMIAPNERLTPEQTKRKGYFVLHQDRWWLVNEDLPDLTDVTTKIPIPIGGKVELKEGAQILLSKQDGGRLVVVQMVEV
ncbi:MULTISPECIES: kinase [unclassified Acinetobacter]|uniref:helix-hairpin-helix domain-containing protein n=1 Tax=unclassified Acinetobacter TaxID=196816 RepID=UPI0025752B16|nr:MULTISPECIES: kinase [unclassified Acinetobacter]MDM1757059.1 kinase [Acinetobacter sp. 256-1]MDM1760159.1 kinase [Acinetobacter sp. 251-1]